jgi:glycosyltransferase involved in cell wall biosynthesis
LILAVGELCRRKDFTTLILAFRRMAASSDARLMIIGEGRQRRALERLVERCGLEQRVTLPGFISNPYPYMAQADLLVLSSICEGLGLVLVEALAAGTPVVATDCPSGPREVLQDGRIGPLAPCGEPLALSRAMQSVLAAPPPGDILRTAVLPYHVRAATDRYLSAMGIGPPQSAELPMGQLPVPEPAP